MMRYFENEGEVFGYDPADPVQAQIIAGAVAEGWKEITGHWPPAPTPEQIAGEVAGARANAYHLESDPLFFKAQRGEATMDQWLAKVAEIKARFPDGVMPS